MTPEAFEIANRINDALDRGEYKDAIIAWTQLNSECERLNDFHAAFDVHRMINDKDKWVKAIKETNPPGIDNDPGWYNSSEGDSNE